MSWVDLDSGAASKAAEILKSLEETDTIDQLGLGVLRDSLSDHLFPATSTLMTRAKYFFVVARAFEELRNAYARRPKELGRDSLLRARLAEIERRQAEALIRAYRTENGADLSNSGIIGWTIVTKREGFVANPPTDIYWTAVRDLEMVGFGGSSAGYRKSILTQDVSAGLGDQESEDETLDWDPNIPKADTSGVSMQLALSGIEAAYLKERFSKARPDSLLGSLIRDPQHRKDIDQAEFPWELKCLKSPWKMVAEKGKSLSALMRGANLVYNRFLGTLLGSKFANQAETELLGWVDDSDGLGLAVGADLDFEWLQSLVAVDNNLHEKAREFLRGFRDQYCAKGKLAELKGRGCRAYFEQREVAVKHGSARLRHESARRGIKKLGGRGQADFRWSTAKVILLDVFNGIGTI